MATPVKTPKNSPADVASDMTVQHKLILGAIGAVTPLALNLLVVDQLTLVNLTFLACVGYTIRLVILVGLGALIVYLNIDETNRTRIFQLGVAAPALATALINGANQRTLLKNQQFVVPPTASVLVADLHAQAKAQPAKEFAIPKETQAEQVWRGLTGSRSDRVWFVVAARESTREAAAATAAKIASTHKNFAAEIYAPYEGKGSWSVVIGAGLTRADAMVLRQKAVGAGMADADLWTPPADQSKN